MIRAAALLFALALAACRQPAPHAAAPAEAVSAPVTVGALTLEKAISRPPLGGQTTGVGYLTIRNDGDTADRLVAATTPAATTVELHTHTMAEGVMRMDRVDGVDIPAHGEVVFAPKGLHLMLFNFAPTGPTAPITLKFEMAGEATVSFPVSAVQASD
jgi:copper(I)-binding protein